MIVLMFFLSSSEFLASSKGNVMKRKLWQETKDELRRVDPELENAIP